MSKAKTFKKIAWREVVFQLILHFLVFIFYTYDRTNRTFEFYHIVFFLNYAIAAAIISYILIPTFFYKKKYLIFTANLILLIIAVILTEEFFLEKVFFPNTKRSDTFPGVFFMLADILPVIAILSGFKFTWDAIVKQRQVEKLTSHIQESELQFLKSQINPHFLFNNLNNLYSYAIEASPKTPVIILELSSVLRYMLYECKARYVSISKEIEHLKNFTQLNELQIEERGVINFSVENINTQYEIAPLILVVFIENAFKHSQSAQSEDIKINIDISMTEDVLNFHCSNNFVPINKPDNLTHGIGLKNVKKRLELLYPDAHQLKINEHDNFYQIHLTLKLHKIV
ncbi:histidine kinase [Tamlana sp. s12]|uniref:sensor histidine kinase n=1 Tax=Tamlana sp. s12 TaxID=1630406 RepID=UPI0007FEF324|nr:histidine kinase [Tamlana sp. s12]OBQ56352.1 histidine kinase [Tamlana sp. s12]QQY82031.1 histidine kinase [Tamlana sp. s12]